MDAVILAAGVGRRMNVGYNKVFYPVNGHEILWHTVKAFSDCDFVENIIVVTGADDIKRCENVCERFNVSVVRGGETRQESSYIGVCASNADFVLIHDGARPCVSQEDIRAVAESARACGAASVGTPCTDTLKLCRNGIVEKTVDRSNIYKTYTPQGFERKMIKELHEKAFADGISVTDDCSVCEAYGKMVRIVDGNPLNIKITSKSDIRLAELLLH